MAGFSLSALRLALQEYQEEWDQDQTWTMKFEDPAQALDPGGLGVASGDRVHQSKDTEAEMEKDSKIQVYKAMTNDVAVAKIADFLPVGDLMTLRATCKLWNSIFVNQLRKKHQRIRLQVSNGVNHHITKRDGENVREFTEAMKSSLKIPFSQYTLMDFKNRREHRESFQDFASVCGEAVTQLLLHGFWKWEVNWETSVIRQALFDQMPNLTDLQVNFFTPWPHQTGQFDDEQGLEEVVPTLAGAGEGGNQMLSKLKRLSFGFGNQQTTVELCAQLVSKMIQCAPGLEILELPPYNEDTYDRDYTFLQTVLTHLRDLNKNVYKLKHLAVGHVNLSILQLLLELATPKRDENGLRLERFVLLITGKGWKDGVPGDEGRERREMTRILGKFLASQASTLLELCILLRTTGDASEANSTDLIPIALPQLDRLHTLTFSDSNDEEFDLHFDGDTFASNFPALKNLQYYINYNIMNPRDSDDTTAHIIHPGLTDLSIKTKLPHLAMLPTRFTSVSTLHLRLNLMWMTDTQEDHGALASVWSLWPTLTHLSLSLEFNADKDLVRPDELLTGVARQQMNALRHHLTYSESTVDAFRGLVLPYKTRPGVSDLRQLKEFNLDWSSWGGPSGEIKVGALCRLTDIGVCCGLALCGPQLQHIDIGGTLRNLVSEPCMKFMKSSNVFGQNAVIKLTPWNVREWIPE